MQRNQQRLGKSRMRPRKFPATSRRRFLQTAGAGAFGVAGFALVGCGDDDDGNGNGNGAPSPTSPTNGEQPEPTPASGEPRYGGTWQAYAPFSPPNFDPNEQNFMTTAADNYCYSRLYQRDSGPGVDVSQFVGDVAESLPEITDDGLQYIIRLRQDVQFHPPVERALTAEDVVFSYRRNIGEVEGIPPAAVSADLTTIIERVEAPDDQTVVFTINRPYVPFLARLGDPNMLALIPTEFEDVVNPAQNMVGSGPWLFDSHTPGTVVSFRRNPNWHRDADVPYLDATNLNIVPEYATQLSQFLGGNLDEFTPSGGDLQRIVDTIPEASFSTRVAAGASYMFFSARNADDPWRDPLVRQAISVAIDRDDLLDAAYELPAFDDAGIDYQRVWNSFIPAGWGDPWLDPLSESTREYYEYNPQRAMELLSAAGYEDGFEARFPYSTGYGQPYLTMTELVIQFLSRVGITLTGVGQDQASEFLPETYRSGGDFDGISWTLQTLLADPGDYFEQMYTPGYLRNKSAVDDPDIAERAATVQANLDTESRIEQMHDLQADLVEPMYYVPMPAGGHPGVLAFSARARNAVEYRPWQDTYNGTTARPWYWVAE